MPRNSERWLTGDSFTKYGWSVCFWILIVAFQYGYHISALNQIKDALTCKLTPTNPNFAMPYHYGLPACIPMSDFAFSLVTSIFTIGGLAGSLFANLVMDSRGRKGASRICAAFTAIGSCLMGLSSSMFFLVLGRFLIGVGSGIGLCVGPIFLAEISPSRIGGNVGVLTQLGIVLGIMLTQVAGLRFATETQWRLVLFISCALSSVQFLASPLVVESPAWLVAHRRLEERKEVAQKLWGFTQVVLPSDEPLLEDAPLEVSRDENVKIPELIISRDLRKPLMIVGLAMLSQQVSGINAVLYYSNDILSKSLPSFGPYLSLGITVVNVLMTFPPIILIERTGRKTLLLASVIGAIISLFSLGYGLNTGSVTLSSITIITFVMSFAIGLGPIPFVMIPEVSPSTAVSALSSVALSLNWVANFFVGLLFLPLRNFLAGGDRLREGRVFYVFAAVLLSSTFMLSRVYRG